MILAPIKDSRKQRLPLSTLLARLVLANVLIGLGVWALAGCGGKIDNPVVSTPTSSPAVQGVSPLIFGTNLSFHDLNDQILNSADARTLLQQLHMGIIRMPTRSQLPESAHIQLFQAIKSLGATPLIILTGK